MVAKTEVSAAAGLQCTLQKHHHAIMDPVLFAAVIALFLTKATALAAVTGYFLNR